MAPANNPRRENETMDARELALKLLEWEKLKLNLDALAAEIETAVLKIGKTQTVGNARASYSKGRRSYDYQEAADGHLHVSEATVSLFTTIIPQTEKVDWRGICKHAGIDDVPFVQSEPKVTLKLLS